MERHLKSHNNDLFPCHFCQFRAAYDRALQDHINAHFAIFNYKCNECNLKFSQATGLRRHNDKNHDHLVFKCGICEKIFNSRDSTQIHLRRTHKLAGQTVDFILKITSVE